MTRTKPSQPGGPSEPGSEAEPEPTVMKDGESAPPIPVVGIGGSAGSLEALKQFFAALPADLDTAFVIIQHLDPTRESLLADLLAGCTSNLVQQAQDGMPVEAGHVYVIPPNAYLTLEGGLLRLREPPKNDVPRMPIDIFFRSLAEDRQDHAICIILSGAGSDGALGLRAVRGAGGLSIAQDPASAQYADMPRNAIGTGLVDVVLPPALMGEALRDYLAHVRGRPAAPATESAAPPNVLEAILTHVLARTVSDFRDYKKTTIIRRIERRMGLAHLDDMAAYLTLLKEHPEESR